MDKDSFEFVIYIIHTCANRWNMSPAKVYAKMQEAGCIDDYLVPYYDVLHTQSSSYVADDVQQYLLNRGVAV